MTDKLYDEAAVDAFAAVMKRKLARKRAEGRSGWQFCQRHVLSRMLREHVDKGDPVDVANFAMMLHQRGEQIEAPHPFDAIFQRAKIAAAKASVKFPQPNYITLKIAEEAGEVVRGCVHYAEKRMPWAEVEGEIVQLVAMLIRLVTEGDQIKGVQPPLLEGTRE